MQRCLPRSRWPGLSPRGLSRGRRETTSENCPLKSTCAPWHRHHTATHEINIIKNASPCYVKIYKLIGNLYEGIHVYYIDTNMHTSKKIQHKKKNKILLSTSQNVDRHRKCPALLVTGDMQNHSTVRCCQRDLKELL